MKIIKTAACFKMEAAKTGSNKSESYSKLKWQLKESEYLNKVRFKQTD